MGPGDTVIIGPDRFRIIQGDLAIVIGVGFTFADPEAPGQFLLVGHGFDWPPEIPAHNDNRGRPWLRPL